MLDETGSRAVIARLGRVLERAGTGAAVRAQARRLRDRLTGGVRVVIVGPGGVGKSQICDVLLEGVFDRPTGWGLCARRHTDEADLPPDAENLTSATRDVPLLTTASVTDVAMPDDPAAFAARAEWALERADIVVWCTQEFGPQEAAIWAQAPDHLKDHSFLVLTKADALVAEGRLAGRITVLQPIAAEEFHSFFPTSTCHVHQALRQQGTLPAGPFAASGVKALRDAVSGLIAAGQRADIDGALLFLQRYEVSDPVRPAAGRQAAAPQDQTYEKALTLLRDRLGTLCPSDGTAPQTESILATCGALAEELAELAADQTHSAPAFDAWRNDLYEASDKVVLMGLESDMRSAADAVTVVLQLKRDLEARVIP